MTVRTTTKKGVRRTVNKPPVTELDRCLLDISQTIANPNIKRVMFVALLEDGPGIGKARTVTYIGHTDGCSMLQKLAKSIPDE